MHHAYDRVTLICMRTTLDLDQELVEGAMKAIGAKTKTEAVEAGLRVLVDIENRRRIKALFGSEPTLKPVPRRRPTTS